MASIGTEPTLLRETAPPALGGPVEQLRRGLRWPRLLLILFLILLSLSFLTPGFWMLNASLRSEAKVLEFPPRLGLLHPEWANYQRVFESIGPYLLNSIRLAALNVVGSCIVSSLAGFAFARLRFAGRDALFGIVLVTAIVPSVVYLLPQYILFQKFGWVDTLYPLWVPQILTPVFGSFLMRQAFKTLPAELDESARVDGASTFRIFVSIMVPLVKPAIASVAIFSFLGSWNDLFGPLIFLTSPEKQTLPIFLAEFQGEFATSVAPLMAAATVTVVPVLIIFLLAQRYFVQGVTGSALKG